MKEIKPIWSDEKKAIATYKFTGATMESVKLAKETVGEPSTGNY